MILAERNDVKRAFIYVFYSYAVIMTFCPVKRMAECKIDRLIVGKFVSRLFPLFQ